MMLRGYLLEFKVGQIILLFAQPNKEKQTKEIPKRKEMQKKEDIQKNKDREKIYKFTLVKGV